MLAGMVSAQLAVSAQRPLLSMEMWAGPKPAAEALLSRVSAPVAWSIA